MMRLMKKRWVCLVIMTLVLIGLCPIMTDANQKRVYDQASLFTEEKINELETKIGELQVQNNYDFVIVSTNDAKGKSARDYADDFYDDNNFGFDNQKSGVLLLLDMDNREIWISTSGEMIDILTDKRIESILDDIYPKMVNSNYEEAADVFLSDTVFYIEQGIPAGQYRETLKESKPISKAQRAVGGLLAGLLFGAIVSGISCFVTVRRYKGRRGQGGYAYQQEGKMQLMKKNDMFLNKYVTQRRIPKNPPSQRSSSGRSSVHSSSSGRTHGGGGRKF